MTDRQRLGQRKTEIWSKEEWSITQTILPWRLCASTPKLRLSFECVCFMGGSQQGTVPCARASLFYSVYTMYILWLLWYCLVRVISNVHCSQRKREVSGGGGGARSEIWERPYTYITTSALFSLNAGPQAPQHFAEMFCRGVQTGGFHDT